MRPIARKAQALFADALQGKQLRCARCLVEDGLFSLRTRNVPGCKILVKKFSTFFIEVIDHGDTVGLLLRAAVVEGSRERND